VLAMLKTSIQKLMVAEDAMGKRDPVFKLVGSVVDMGCS